MMAAAKAKARSGQAWVQAFWQEYRVVSIVLLIAAVVLFVFLLWLFGVIGNRTSWSATQLAPGTDEQTIAKAFHDQSVKEFAPVNKRLDALEAGQKAVNADIGSIKSDIGQLKSGQTAIQNRKLDGNLLMKFMDELDKKDPPTKPVSRLEGTGGNFRQSPA